jgi:uncharacterized protein (TIGR03437 family)
MTNAPCFAKIGAFVLGLPLLAAAATAIDKIQNNYSYILPGLPNYGIAPGSLFLITGTDLADPNTPTLQPSTGAGLPLVLNNASISVTINGTTTHPAMYYATATAIAAVLPSSTPTGTGTITVTSKGTVSAPVQMVVVPAALGFDTYYGTGIGLAVATDPTTGAVFTNANSIKPGQTTVLWCSGLGAPTDSDAVYTSTPAAVKSALQVFVGGIQAAIQYQGGSGYPGVNQINVVVPPSVQPGCGVSVVAVSDSIVSNTVVIPVSANGGACADPLIDAQQPINSTRTSYKSGALQVSQSMNGLAPDSSAGANFASLSDLTYTAGNFPISVGSCYTLQTVLGPAGPGPTSTGLDAGVVTITGPVGILPLDPAQNAPGNYISVFPAGFLPASGGSFTFSGKGGNDVGQFTVNLNLPTSLAWTNRSSVSTVNRSDGVTFNWSGGAPGTYVTISGQSSAVAGNAASPSAAFACNIPVSAGQFTVPSNVLLALPPGSGSLTIQNFTLPVPFAATGLDYAYAQGYMNASAQVSWR